MLNFRQAEVGDRDRIYAIHTSAILELCSTSYSEESVRQWAARQTPSQYSPSSRPERLHWPLPLKRKLWGSGTWYKGAKVAVRVKSRVCLFLIGGQGKVWAAPYCCTWNSRQGRVATLRFMWSRLSMPRDSMRRWATLLSMYRTHMCVVTRLFSAFQWTNIYSDITNMHII